MKTRRTVNTSRNTATALSEFHHKTLEVAGTFSFIHDHDAREFTAAELRKLAAAARRAQQAAEYLAEVIKSVEARIAN